MAHLHGKIREKTRVGLAVVDINPGDPSRRQGIEVLAIDRSTEQVLGFRADQVVFAAPHFLTRYVLRSYRENAPRHLEQFEYGSWMVANLFVRERPQNRGFPLAWDNVIYESPSLGYVVATHQRGIDRGGSVFTYYYPLCDANVRTARTKLLGMDWQSCADLVMNDLRRAHPDMDGLAERLDVMRWGHAMIRPNPGFIWGGARQAASQPYRGVHFAHSDLSGVSLFEEAFYHGLRAAEEVLQAREQRF